MVIENSTSNYNCSVERWSTNVAPFETKTKDDYAWRNEYLNNNHKMIEVDINDKGVWRQGTILSFFEEEKNSRKILMAKCGLRIYRENTGTAMIQKDEFGTFKGFSSRFDEDIPVFCPRIVPFNTVVNKSKDNDADLEDLEEEMDSLFPVPEGM